MGHATPLQNLVPPGRATLVVGVAAGAVALGTTAVALGYGDGQAIVPGLPDAGAFTGWGLPLARLTGDLAAALVAGNALAAAFWSDGPAPGGAGARHRAFAARAALVWVAAAVVAWLLTISDELGRPVTDVLTSGALGGVGFGTPPGRARAVAAGAAVAALLLARRAPTATLGAALLGIAPSAFVAQEVPVADTRLAAGALLFHLGALTLWTGALGALLLRLRAAATDRGAATDGAAATGPAGRDALQRTAGWYGRAALACVCAAGAGAILHAVLVLGPSDTGLDSAYGRLVAVELVALAALAAIGHWHRTQTIPAIGRGLTAPFLRFAVLELVLLGAVAGLIVALSRVPAPLESGAGAAHHESAGVQMFGYDLPASLSFGQLATGWRLDLVWLVVCAALAAGYLRLETRAHRAGVVWPARRGVAWLAGVAVVLVATNSGVARYTAPYFSVAMIQHLLLAVAAPLLLVRAAPLTLALRAGPGGWLRTVLRSRTARYLTSPVTVVALWAAGPFGVYFTGVFEEARWSYATELLVDAVLLLSGVLVVWFVSGTDPRPGARRGQGSRLAVVVLAAGTAAAAGVLLAVSGRIVAPEWYTGLLRVMVLRWPWGSASVQQDQVVGATLLWAVSTLLGAVYVADRAAARIFGRRGRDSGDHERAGAAAR
ncbi:cytochrome c oxidase assembly protein [Cryptosporangium sp. NPDC051539]|uniref:cytochrome c oxidase assembly protein n=1 Tax=Cryptosporangium sp. NPDC051539 TaxID=3363962 RepID=UPI0037AD25AB